MSLEILLPLKEQTRATNRRTPNQQQESTTVQLSEHVHSNNANMPMLSRFHVYHDHHLCFVSWHLLITVELNTKYRLGQEQL